MLETKGKVFLFLEKKKKRGQYSVSNRKMQCKLHTFICAYLKDFPIVFSEKFPVLAIFTPRVIWLDRFTKILRVNQIARYKCSTYCQKQ